MSSGACAAARTGPPTRSALRSFRRLAGACCALAAIAWGAAGARADESIEMRWLRCSLDAGLASRSFDCSNDVVEHRLVVALSVAAPIDSVLGLEADIALQGSSPELPDWWQLQPGGCRAGRIGADRTFDFGSNCEDPFGGAGVAVFQSLTVGEPRGQANQARLLASATVSSNQPGMLVPGPVYQVCRVVIRSGGTVSAPACAGCSEPACLVLNEVRVVYLSQGVFQTARLTLPAAGNGNWIGWQSTPGPPCLTVPTRRTSWGAIKTLYR